MRRSRRGWPGAWALGLLCGLMPACGDSFESTTPQAFVLPEITPPKEMARGDSAEVGVKVLTAAGESIDGAIVAWTTSDPGVVTLQRTASLRVRLTAVGSGRAVISGSVADGVSTDVPQLSLVDTVTVHERWIAVDVGRGMACGLNSDSVAYCWRPTRGSRDPLQPEVVPGLFDIPASDLQVGHASACVLLGISPYCWGRNGMGELGLGVGNTNRQLIPVQGFIDEPAGAIKRIAAGGAFMCLDIEHQELACFGNATFRQLGRPTPTAICSFGDKHPCGTNRIGPMVARSIGAGENHACVIEDSGELVCWGADAMGQLGTLGPDTLCVVPGSQGGVPCSDTPTVVAAGHSFIAVSTGWDHFQDDSSPTWLGESHTCAIEADSTVYCWGKNNNGQLGVPPGSTTCPRVTGDIPEDVPCSPTPAQITNLGKYKAVVAGSDHTCGIRNDDRVYCWGLNDRGQLGDGRTEPWRPDARQISIDSAFSSLDAGPDYTCALTKSSGAIFCWGEVVGDTPQRLKDP
jgi:alpha-tubulin suppressor-like RCC1 family protein